MFSQKKSRRDKLMTEKKDTIAFMTYYVMLVSL